MLPTWAGVRVSAQPGTRQQTPIGTEACSTVSHVNPDGHFGALGSHSTRAFGMLGLRVQAAPSASAIAAKKEMGKGKKDPFDVRGAGFTKVAPLSEPHPHDAAHAVGR